MGIFLNPYKGPFAKCPILLIKNLLFQLRSIWLILILFLFFYRAICMHDQSPTILSSISKLEEGLKTYGLLKSIREQPLIWEPVFVSGSAPSLTATAFLNELLVDFSLSDVKKQKEIDVFYHFTNYIQSLNTDGLQRTLK